MSLIKNMSPFLFAIVMLSTIGFVMLLPLEDILSLNKFSKFESEYIGLSIKMGSLFVLGYSIIKKLNLFTITGLSSTYKWEFKYLNLIPIYLLIIGLLTVINKDLSDIKITNVFILFLGCLAVGFAEEFIFRGLLQSLFLKKYMNHKRGLFLGVFVPALCFGLFHLVNLGNSDQILPVIIQVVFATFIGFYFGVLVLKTNKLIPIAITHGLINFFLSLQTLPSISNATTYGASSDDLGAALAPLVLFLPLFIVGLFVIRKINREELQHKLQLTFIP
ncbi:MAG: CPBP family intramembrane metalloprotease [Flavobacteriaceae bacterium]|nr:CPBP family intramembrane metalloprotease [Flavobacteriaceae bacterium]